MERLGTMRPGFLNSTVTAQFTKPLDCLPTAGMLSRDHSSIQDLRDVFRSTGIAPGKAGNGSVGGFVNRAVKLMVIFVLPGVSTPFGHLICICSCLFKIICLDPSGYPSHTNDFQILSLITRTWYSSPKT